MFKKAKKSVRIMTTDAGLKELEENHYNVLKKAATSGVKVPMRFEN